MGKTILKSLVVAGILCMAPTAFAQGLPTAGEATGAAGGGGVVYKKETVYDFDGDDVEGNLVKPDEANITGEQHGKTSSLIKIRADFIPEMIKSVENI